MNEKRRDTDAGARRYLQYWPVATLLLSGLIAFTDLKSDVQAQTAAAKTTDRSVTEQRRRVRQNEKSINALKTQTAVIKNTVDQIQRTLDSNREDIKAILDAVRK